jgi:VCBS repeat protein
MDSWNRRIVGLLGLFLASIAALVGCQPSGSSGNDDLSALPRGLFPFPTRVPLGDGQVVGIARGDLDGDGIADLAVTMGYDTPEEQLGVHLLYMGRTGFVESTQRLADTRNPIGVSIADLDGDGRNDVTVLDAIGELAVYLQTSPGLFAAPVPYSVGDRPIVLVEGDFTGDGELDYLTANNSGLDVTVLVGRGDGTFEPVRTSPCGTAPQIATAGDVNLDGDLDVVVGGFNDLELLLGLGTGRFGPPQVLPSGFANQGVRIGEVTGDPFPDVVRSSGNDRELVVLEGDGLGGFTEGYTFFVGNPFLGELELGDLDEDGKLDIALASSAGLHALINQGGGTFAPRPAVSAGGNIGSFLVADVDGNLTLDLIAPTLQFIDFDDIHSNLNLLAGRGNGSFVGPSVYAAGDSPRGLLLDDFVVDGIPDAVVASSSALAVLPGMADGSFGAPIETDLSMAVGVMTSADLDGNTLVDLLFSNANYGSGELALLSSQGNGLFDPPVIFPAGGVSPAGMELADLDGDSVLDLVVANAISNQIAVHIGQPGGTFAKALRFGTGFGPTALLLADLDGDGTQDVVAANQSDRSVSVLAGIGAGSFAPDVAYPVASGPYSLAAGDVDRDGDLDLAVACIGDFDDQVGGLGFLYGNGDGTFGPFVPEPRVVQAAEVQLADLNADGRLDLVWTDFSQIFVSLDKGPGFDEPRVYFGASLQGLVVRNVNGDARPDIVAINGQSEGQLLVFLNQGPSRP